MRAMEVIRDWRHLPLCVLALGCATGLMPLLANDADDLAFTVELAKLEARFGHQQEAVGHFRAALAGKLDDEQIWACKEGLAQVLTQLGDHEALPAFAREQIASHDPLRNAAGHALLIDEELTHGAEAQAVKHLIDQALHAGIAAYRDAARQRLQELQGPAITAARADISQQALAAAGDSELRELALVLMTDPSAKADLLLAAWRATPADVDLQQRTAEALLAADRKPQAKALLLKLLRDQPGLANEIQQTLAKVLAASNDPLGAEAAVIASASGQEPGFARSLYLARTFAGVFLWTPAEAQARTAYDEAAALGDAHRAAAAIELGDALLHLGRKDEAVALLTPLAAQTTWTGLAERAAHLLSLAPTLAPAPAPLHP